MERTYDPAPTTPGFPRTGRLHRARGRISGGGAGTLPLATNQPRRALPAWRRRGPDGAAGGGGDGESPQAARRRGQQDGSGRRRGDSVRGHEQARRLHTAPGALQHLDHPGGRQALRPPARLHRRPVRSGGPHLGGPDHPRGARREPVENSKGLHRRREEAAEPDLVQLVGYLRHAPHGDGAPLARGWDQAAPRAVCGRRPCADRAARRSRGRPRLGAFGGPAADQGGQASRARGLGG